MLFRFPRLRKEALERERELSLISLDNCAIRLNGVLVFIRRRKKINSSFNSISKNAHEQIIFSFKLFDLFDYWSEIFLKRDLIDLSNKVYGENRSVLRMGDILREFRSFEQKDFVWAMGMTGGTNAYTRRVEIDESYQLFSAMFLFFFGFENCYYKIEERRNNGISFHRLNPSTVEIQFIRAQEKGINDT